MKIFLFGIYDRLSDQYIHYYPSTNSDTSKREFSNFLIKTKENSPMVNLEEFQLILITELPRIGGIEFKESLKHQEMFPLETITNGKIEWEKLMRSLDLTDKQKENIEKVIPFNKELA